MRSFLVIFAVFGCAIAGPALFYDEDENSVYNYGFEPEVRALEKEVNKSLECVRDILNKGLPDKGLPSFNPLVIKNLTVNLDELGLGKNLTGKVSVKSVQVNGITSWFTKALKGKLGIIPPSYDLQAEITVERAHGSGEYDGSVKILDKHHIFGKGKVSADVQKINIKANIKLKTSNKKFKVEKFSLILAVGKVNATVTGFLNDPEKSKELSKWLNDLPKFLQQNPNWIDQNLSAHIKDTLNQGMENSKPGSAIDHIIKQCSPF